MLLDRKMGVSLKEKSVLEKFICFGKAFLDVPELQSDKLMDVSRFTVFVNPWLGSRECLLGIGNRFKNFIIDIDQVQCLKCSQLLASDDGGHGISHVAHAIDTESLFVLAYGENPVLDRNVFAGQD